MILSFYDLCHFWVISTLKFASLLTLKDDILSIVLIDLSLMVFSPRVTQFVRPDLAPLSVSVCLSVSVFVCLSLSLFVCLSVSLSVCLSHVPLPLLGAHLSTDCNPFQNVHLLSTNLLHPLSSITLQ